MADKAINLKTFGFGLVALKKFPELIPLVFSLTFACGMAGVYSIYALSTKNDVTVDKRQTSPPWERIDPEKKQKFITHNIKYQKIPELEQLRKEIGSYKY